MTSIPRHTVEEIVDAMFKKNIAQGEVVYKEGDQGLIHIVQSGSFDILERARAEPGAVPAEPVKVFEATPGYAFGDLVVSQLSQSAVLTSVVATEPSTVWCIEAE